MLPWKKPVRAKTTAALAANTYANGTSGVGATLTANANGALAAVDGVTLVANDRVLVDHEASGSHNGIYVVTQVGDASHPYIVTRATDADSGAELVGATVAVSEGTKFKDQSWRCITDATITVGTTALVWKPSTTTLVAGTNVTVTDNGDGTFTVASTGGGGGSGWALAGTGQTSTGVWDQTVDGTKANVDFAGLSGFTEVMIITRGCTLSVSGNVATRASIDNGVSYYSASGDYVVVSDSGTITNGTSFSGDHTTGSTAARYGCIIIRGINVIGAPKTAEVQNITTSSRASWFVGADSSAVNAIRCFPTGGGNITGGKIYCLAR